MKTPVGLLGATLLFWGWQCDLLAVGAVMGFLLESARFANWRLAVARTDWNRLWDLTALLLVGAGVYQYNSQPIIAAVLGLLQWLPMIFLPFMLAQAFGTPDRIPLSTFFWLLRGKRQPERSETSLNVSFAYFALCLLAASAGNVRDYRFYLGLCVLAGYAVWSRRPRRYAPVTVLATFAAAAWLGYFGHHWLQNFQRRFESTTTRWLYGLLVGDFEERDNYTTLGGLAPLKLSGRVVLTLEPEITRQPPALLRQITFTRYSAGTWYGLRRNFRSVNEENPGTWPLLPGKAAKQSVVLSTRLPRGKGLLALPPGTSRVVELPVLEMERNRLGTVRVANGPEAVTFRAFFGPGETFDGPPDRLDFEIPERERAALETVAEQLGLEGKTPEEILDRVANFFEREFEYTLAAPGPAYRRRGGQTWLSEFLLKRRAGHCEYFATATVLLLRHAGLPARYATGYSVQETARHGNRYLVRERHGHAWTLVYVNGRWQDFDTTPATWDAQEREEASLFQPVFDAWSDLLFRFTLWRWTDSPGALTKYLFAGLVLLAAVVAIRLVRRNRPVRLTDRAKPRATPEVRPGMDSEFYRIETYFRQQGLPRAPAETFTSWLKRLAGHRAVQVSGAELDALLALHYRYRFDPAGLTPPDREALAAAVRRWLDGARTEREPAAGNPTPA